MSSKQRLMRYTAAIGSLAAAGSAVSAVQPIPEQIIEGVPGGSIWQEAVDLNGDGVNNFGVSISNSAYGYSYLAISGLSTGNMDFPYNQVASFYDGSSFFAEKLDGNDLVDGDLDFSSNFITIWREFPPAYEEFNGQRGFIGIRFDIPGNSPHFACVEITVDDVSGNGAQDLHILGGVFDDETDVPVLCPGEDVPPPAAPIAVPVNGLAFWLTALLAGGVMLYTGRRRRKQEI